ncbi:hypothetical protein GN956_G11776 [Arapaima gigas]
MATADAGGLLCRRNSKLESFLKRNTERSLYERFRAYEPCVVVSENLDKVFMYVVLSDDSIHLVEFPPRTVRRVAGFRDVTDISLVNDLPDFLSGRDRDCSQHICVVHTTTKGLGGKHAWWQQEKSKSCPPASPSQRKTSSPHDGPDSVLLSTYSAPPKIDSWKATSPSRRGEEDEGQQKLKQRRSTFCFSADLKELHVSSSQHLPMAFPSSSRLSSCVPLSAQRGDTGRNIGPGWRGSILTRLMKKRTVERQSTKEESRRTELHLYAVSPSSRIYLHLQSSWNSCIIRSTLLLDHQFRKRFRISPRSCPQKQHWRSWECTAHLFSQLSWELLQENITLESLYLLLQELSTAAHRNTTIRRLFWKSSDLCLFLVRILEDTLQDHLKISQEYNKIHRADKLILATLVAQILGLMFRETEVESARFSLLTAKRGALTERLLLALVCDPEMDLWNAVNGPLIPSQDPLQAQQNLLVEYLDAASALLFEVLVMSQQATYTSGLEHFVTVGWVLKTLQSHSFALPFISYMAQWVVLVLSHSVLSPAQAVLLHQRSWVLLTCLQNSASLSQHIRTMFQEEFRYYVNISWMEDKLPPHYPISQPTIRIFSQVLHLVLQSS